MIATSDRPCWLAEACEILLLLLSVSTAVVTEELGKRACHDGMMTFRLRLDTTGIICYTTFIVQCKHLAQQQRLSLTQQHCLLY